MFQPYTPSCESCIPVAGPIVKLKQGKLRGRKRKSQKKVTYFSFQGIPYGKPPLKELRFKAPEPAEPWTDSILDATRERPCCYQRHVIEFYEMGHEDCLYINVFTPQISKKSPLYPVLVWIHGTLFVAGSGNSEFFYPGYLMNFPIVLVTFHYRVGMLGTKNNNNIRNMLYKFSRSQFRHTRKCRVKRSSFGIEMGTTDIKKFRGDPNNVTLGGSDAGAASAHLHMLSPMSKGLFKRVILQSGCALNPWVNGIRGSARMMAVALQIDHDNEQAILERLLKASTVEIFAAQQLITNLCTVDEKWVCSPVVERQNDHTVFLPDEPINIILSGNYFHVPMIIGYTSREGIAWDVFNRNIFGVSEVITDFSTVIPNQLYVRKGGLLCKTMEEQILNFYYGLRMQRSRMGRYPRVQKKDPMYQMITDVFYLRGIHSTVKHHVATSPKPIYYYRFSLESKLNFFKNMLPPAQQRKYKGAAHLDDLAYIFPDRTYCHGKIVPEEDELITKMITLFVNFAKIGDPKTSYAPWYPVRGTEYQFLEIGPRIYLDFYPDFDRMRFWDGFYKNDKRTEML